MIKTEQFPFKDVKCCNLAFLLIIEYCNIYYGISGKNLVTYGLFTHIEMDTGPVDWSVATVARNLCTAHKWGTEPCP